MEFLIGTSSSIVAKVAEYTVGPICRQFGYLFYYKSNVQDLQNQIQELGYTRDRLQHRIDEAIRNGEEIEADVVNWLSNVDRIKQESEDFLGKDDHARTRCSSNGPFPNMVSRHQLSRKAKKMVQVVKSEILKVDKFDKVSYRPPIEYPVQNRGYEAFDSRVKILKLIIEALKGSNFKMIGIYGMGGIGKTVLAKEVARKVKEEKLFSKVAITTVSQTPNIESIQQDIAEQIGLEEFSKIKSELVRASRLRQRLSQEMNILIILDDLWSQLDLSSVGIEFADDQKVCKILLTSRFLYVVQDFMGAEMNIKIEDLSDMESMALFKKHVGASIENDCFQSVAKKIVKECAGLPIAISTVANALKNKSLLIWEDALVQLERCTLTNIEGMHQKVYSSIKLSYNVLEGDEEARSLLLLSSLHEEDANIAVEDLMIYAVGWNLLKEVYTIEEARNRVYSLVSKLKDRCLLLEGYLSDHDYVKMHDIIRDVMISIASEDKHMHTLTNFDNFEEFSAKKRLGESTAISLLGNHLNKFPERLECPQLKLFFLFNTTRKALIAGQCFEQKKKLEVLCLRNIHLQLLPRSFSSLQNLQALCLCCCNLGDTTLIGELKLLKILDLRQSTVEMLPKHIGQLTLLQMLNLEYCRNLKVIEPGVISNLKKLEELNMEGVPMKWDEKGVNGLRCNASLVELKNLPKLTRLCIRVQTDDILPKDLFSDRLKRYKIYIGDTSHDRFTSKKSYNRLHLNLPRSNMLDKYGLEMIIERSEVLCLYEFAGVKNIVYQLNKKGFPQLKCFQFKGNDEIQCVVEQIHPHSAFQNLEQLCLVKLMNLEKIYDGKLSIDSFGKLRFLTVSDCDRLKYLFSSSIARRLEKIEVTNCKMIKEIIISDTEDGDHTSENRATDVIEFPHLRSLTLDNLPEFIQFFQSGLETSNASSYISPLPLFSKHVVVPCLEELTLESMKFTDLYSDQLPIIHFRNLTHLDVRNCDNLKHLFSFTIAQSFVQLERLWVVGCSNMVEVLRTEQEQPQGKLEKISFPKLKQLWLYSLPKLERFCVGDAIKFPMLTKLDVQNCPMLKTFINSSISKEINPMPQQPLFTEKVVVPCLEELTLRSMKFTDLCSDQLPIIHFRNLTRLEVQNCDNLKHLFSFTIAQSFVQLERLWVVGCSNIVEVLRTEQEQPKGKLEKISFPKLKQLQLDSLPKLERFCVGDDIKFPMLTKLSVRNCPMLKTFISSSISKEINPMPQQPLFTEKVIFSDLKVLSLDGGEVLHEIWHHQLPMVSFSTLKSLSLSYDQENSTAFSFKSIQKFVNLEELYLEGMVEELCLHQENDALEEPDWTLLRLKELELFGFPNLKYLFENLHKVKPNKAFHAIEALDVHRLGRLERLVPFLDAFKNLKDLRVVECPAMINVLVSSTVKSLPQLTRMSINSCKQMKEIIGSSEGEIVDEIVFSRLRILVLHDLQSLQCFYPGKSAIRFPVLCKLIMSECPEMRSFSSGIVTSQNLNEIVTEIVDTYIWRGFVINWYLNSIEFESSPKTYHWESDINTTIQKIWEDDPLNGLRDLFIE